MKKVRCTCGCNKLYIPSNQKPVDFEIVETNSEGEILSIKREDEVIFRVGETIKRITETGKKYRRFVLTTINVHGDKINMFGYTVDSLGGVGINNEACFYGSAQNPNLLRFIYK